MINIIETHDLRVIISEWKQLWNGNKNASVYQSPEYVELVWNHLLPYRIILISSPRFYMFYKDDKPILILPLFYSLIKKSYYLFGYKTGCGYCDAVYAEGFSEEELSECLFELKKQYSINCINLSNVREASILSKYAINRGCKLSNLPCTCIELSGDYDSYFKALSKNMRQNLRTAYNRIVRDKHEILFSCLSYQKVCEKEKKLLLNIYIERQITKYRHFGSFFFKYFVKKIDIGTFAESCRGLEDVFVLKIDGEIAAFFDAIHENDGIVVPRLSIVEKFSTYSPGILLLNESIKWLYENSCIRRIDLTHGDEYYKIAMGGKTSMCVEDILLLGD